MRTYHRFVLVIIWKKKFYQFVRDIAGKRSKLPRLKWAQFEQFFPVCLPHSFLSLFWWHCWPITGRFFFIVSVHTQLELYWWNKTKKYFSKNAFLGSVLYRQSNFGGSLKSRIFSSFNLIFIESTLYSQCNQNFLNIFCIWENKIMNQ